ncbi:MAG: DUF4129 domain-containing protein [Caldilineaceae bacterium]|nr:DUF4129 domain-containing protein [Caldilineaceae bacterium]
MNSPIVLPWKHAEWSSVEGLLLPVVVAIMRLCWVWPWMMLVQGFLSPSVEGPLMPPLMLIALPVISFSLARWSMPTYAERRDRSRVTEVRRHIASAGFAVLLFMLWLRFLSQDFALWDFRWLPAAGYELIYWNAVQIEVPGAVLFLLLGILLWLRGALDGRGQFHHDVIWLAFLWGGAALALFAWIIPTAGQPPGLFGLLMLFSATGLAGLGVANLRKASGWRRSARVGKTPPNRSWLVGVAVTIGVLLGVALLIGLIIQPEDAAILWRVLGMVWGVIATVLVWIVTAIAYPIFIVLEYLIRLFRSLFGDRSQEQEAQPIAPPPQQEPFPEAPERAVEAVPEPYRWVALLVIAAGVFIIFMLALRLMRSRSPTETDEVRESVLTANLLQAQLAELWSRLRDRFGPGAEEPDPYLSLAGEVDTRRLIRSIYQRLLSLAQTRAPARLRSETPHHYGGRLAEQPDFDPQALGTITAAYNEARYGDEPPSQQTAEDAQRAWRRLEDELSPDQSNVES